MIRVARQALKAQELGGFRTVLAVPLLREGHPVGVMAFSPPWWVTVGKRSCPTEQRETLVVVGRRDYHCGDARARDVSNGTVP